MDKSNGDDIKLGWLWGVGSEFILIFRGCPDVYVRDKRRCEGRFDANDWKVVASFLSQCDQREALDIEELYCGRSGKEKPIDFLTWISM
ncbi:hypothetical protein ACS0TY_005274 [Phlomoides rotata]